MAEGEIFASPYGTVVEAEEPGSAARRGVKRSAREVGSSVGEALAADEGKYHCFCVFLMDILQILRSLLPFYHP